jgi:hypothetical protein
MKYFEQISEIRLQYCLNISLSKHHNTPIYSNNSHKKISKFTSQKKTANNISNLLHKKISSLIFNNTHIARRLWPTPSPINTYRQSTALLITTLYIRQSLNPYSFSHYYRIPLPNLSLHISLYLSNQQQPSQLAYYNSTYLLHITTLHLHRTTNCYNNYHAYPQIYINKTEHFAISTYHYSTSLYRMQEAYIRSGIDGLALSSDSAEPIALANGV